MLNELSARLDEAERKYKEADLEERLRELEEAKQRQVGGQPGASTVLWISSTDCA